ncbi:hypothetical protein QUF93_13865 [Bacillus hominis]|uniref:hypothetical protein n=1 Tax=Bacillus hominis TaxID=2817478 RepID=UPI0025A277DF|nr:hypothetical protein [Bacillus hominis]MDM5193632.1 hypothetical protein [Bacillus hominis]
MDLKEFVINNKTWILGIAGLLIICYFLFGKTNGLTREQFEDKLKEMSNGKIAIVDSEVSEITKDKSLYNASWNGMGISAGIDKDNNITMPFLIGIKPGGQINEITIGQYQELIQHISRIVDPKLSEEDAQHLITNELNFNNYIMNREKHSTIKHDIRYELSPGGDSAPWFTLMITPSKQ